MKTLCFDTGPVISLALNNLLWILEPLKKHFHGEFIIPEAVKFELVDKPLETKRFKLEALQVLELLNKDILHLIDSKDVSEKGYELMDIANRIFSANNHFIKIVHTGEMQAIALALSESSEAIVIDERTTRLMIEKPDFVKHILENKLHRQINVNKILLDHFKKRTRKLKVIRSIELVTIAYEKGITEHYIEDMERFRIKKPKEELLESLLWAMKMKGCAVPEKEILQIVKLEKKLNRL